jgi:surface protein
MFKDSQFNQPIGDWDVSSVTNMSEMFYESTFNQPINLWCVSQIPSEPDNFSTNSPLTPENKPVWGSCIKPEQLTQLQPQNNSTDVLRNVELGWKSDSLSTHFQLQVFEGFNPTVIDTLISDTTYVHHTILKDNFVYNWRVRGINNELKPVRYGEWSSVWKFTTLLDTSIETEDQPTQFSLNQNYPNPFNPTTQIGFSLPQSTHVQLEIYSLLGQRISTLINGSMNSGNHRVSFDGKNLSSGLYIYRLTTPEFTQSRIMNLVK